MSFQIGAGGGPKLLDGCGMHGLERRKHAITNALGSSQSLRALLEEAYEAEDKGRLQGSKLFTVFFCFMTQLQSFHPIRKTRKLQRNDADYRSQCFQRNVLLTDWLALHHR